MKSSSVEVGVLHNLNAEVQVTRQTGGKADVALHLEDELLLPRKVKLEADSKEKVVIGGSDAKVTCGRSGEEVLPRKRRGCEDHRCPRKKKRVCRDLSIEVITLDSSMKDSASNGKRSFVSLLGGEEKSSLYSPSKKACLVDLTCSPPRRNASVIDLTVASDSISLDADNVIDLIDTDSSRDRTKAFQSPATPPLRDPDLTPELNSRNRVVTSTPTSGKTASSGPRKSVSVRKFLFPSPGTRRSESTPPLDPGDLVTPALVVREEGDIKSGIARGVESDCGSLDVECTIEGGATGEIDGEAMDVEDVIVPMEPTCFEEAPVGVKGRASDTIEMVEQLQPSSMSLKESAEYALAEDNEQLSSKESAECALGLTAEDNELCSSSKESAECALGLTAEDNEHFSSKESAVCTLGLTAEESKQSTSKGSIKYALDVPVADSEQSNSNFAQRVPAADCKQSLQFEPCWMDSAGCAPDRVDYKEPDSEEPLRFDKSLPWKATPMEEISIMMAVRGISSQVHSMSVSTIVMYTLPLHSLAPLVLNSAAFHYRMCSQNFVLCGCITYSS